MTYQQLVGDFGQLFTRFEQRTVEFLPNLIGAVALLVTGLVLAYLLRFLARRLVKGLHRLVPSRQLQHGLRQTGVQRPASEIIGNILFWIVILFFLTAATEILGLPIVTTWLNGIALYLPRILSAILIGFAGVAGGILLRDTIVPAATSAGITYGTTLGRLAQGATLLVSLLIAVEQLGLNIAFLTSVLITLIGAVLFGAALAFGLGARTTVDNILAAHYLQKTYTVGHTVKIGDVQGEIVQITPMAVVLESAEDRILVPAKVFSEAASILPSREN